MNANVTITVSFNGDAATISAAVADLLARLESGQATPTSLVAAEAPVEQAPEAKPARKQRAKKVLTDEEKAVVRQRFLDGKAKKAAEREAAAKAAEKPAPGSNKVDQARKAASETRKSASAAKMTKKALVQKATEQVQAAK
jgi:hypothetical protein